MLVLLALTSGCQRTAETVDTSETEEGDGSTDIVYCDPHDVSPTPHEGEEVVGDGVDQDCDGSDHPTSNLREVAAGRYHTALGGAELGWKVACGPDRGGDGVGDLAAIASGFHNWGWHPNFAVALPTPMPGRHAIEDALDLRVKSSGITRFHHLLGLVDQEHGGGLFLENADFDDEVRQVGHLASLVTKGGALDYDTPTFGYLLEDRDVIGPYRPGAYAGPADLTGDGRFDYALGQVVLEAIPEGWVDLRRVGRLALEPGEEPDYGVAVNAIGDLDHDGQDDLLFASGAPAMWLVFGPIGDTPASRDGPNVARFRHESAEPRHVTAVIGDVSGDGVDDVVISFVEPAPPPEDRRGAVYVWFGPLEAGTHTTATADARFGGEFVYGEPGRALALGDFDGDGTKSLVVAAPAYAPRGRPGLVYVFDEPLRPGELTAADAVAIYRGEEHGARAGFDVATCDTDRDGRDELVVGAPGVDASKDVYDAGVFYWLDAVP